MPENSKLTKLVEELKLSRDSSLFNKIGDVLKEYSINDVWLSTIVNSKTQAILTHNVNGREFIPLFSDQHLVQAKGNSVIVTSINKIIEPLLQNPKLGGIEINPFVHGLCIETGTLLQMIIGGRKHYEEERVDWGKGIPNYSDDDILDKQSLLDFGIEIFGGYCNNADILDMFCSNDLNACPNVLIKKDGKLAFVLVNAAVAPDMPKLNYEDRKLLIKRAKQFGFDCYYAPVGIGAADPERFDKSLALRGDAFYANFEGLEKVEETYN